MRESCIRLGIALVLCAGGPLLVSVYAQDQSPESRVKLMGYELRRFATEHAVFAGVNHENDCAFMFVVYPGAPDSYSGPCAFQSVISRPETAQVTWDEVCTKYRWLDGGEPSCWQYYRIALDNYEAWRDGKHVATFSRIK